MKRNFYQFIPPIWRPKLKRSLWLLSLLFILSATIPPVVAEVTKPTPIVQMDSTPQQLVQQAQIAYQQQDLTTASDLWQQAASSFEANQDPLNQAMALSNLSLTQQNLGEWEPAKETIQQSLDLLATIASNESQQQILAQSLAIQGQLQQNTGHPANALESWQQATAIYQQFNQSDAARQSQINQAQALEDLGLYPRACDTLLAVLEPELQVTTCPAFNRLTTEELTAQLDKITEQNPETTTFLALRSLGNLLIEMGQVPQAELALNTSLTIAKTLNDNQELATTYLDFSNLKQALFATEKVRRRRNEYRDEALSSLDRATELATSPITQQQAQLNKLGFLLELENWSQANTLANSLIAAVNQLPASPNKIDAQINLAHHLIDILEQAPAEDSSFPSATAIDRLLADAARQAGHLDHPRLQAYAFGNRGHLAEIQANLSPAAAYTQQAINLVSNFDAPDVSYQYFWQLGRIENNRGRLEPAIAAYTKAYDALQYLRSDLAAINPELQLSFRDRVEPVYRQFVELNIRYAAFLDREGREEEKNNQLILARNVIESLQIAQLNNFFREACIEGTPQVIDSIDPNAAVIYPIILSDRLEILLSLPDQSPELYSTSITASEISSTVERIRAALLSPNTVTEAALPLYQQAYDWLIRPLEQQLTEAQIQTIAFVLDGDLRNIPMSVLHDGEKYLIEKYALALTPGLQLLDPKPITQLNLEAITAGLSEIPEAFQPQFPPLPGVTGELAQIQKMGLAEASLLNEEFTQQALKREITTSGSPIIHLATHATFSSDPEDTFILAWDEPINISELDDLLRDDTFNRPEAIELLVLSACETASGDANATLGLAGVAVQSGARSTIATLWSVVDDSTAQMMNEFYTQLQQSGVTEANKAEALRQAQLTLLNSKTFNHPHFWSPFILIGNWQ